MISRQNHRTVVLVKIETVVGTLREFQSRHVVVFGRCFPSGRDGSHGDVGEDVALHAERTSGPRHLDETVVSLVNGQFAAPIFFEDHAPDHGQCRSYGSSMKFTVNGGKEEGPVIQSYEVNRHLPGREGKAHF